MSSCHCLSQKHAETSRDKIVFSYYFRAPIVQVEQTVVNARNATGKETSSFQDWLRFMEIE